MSRHKPAFPLERRYPLTGSKFAEMITERIEAHPNIEIIREEVTTIPGSDSGDVSIIATGPLTSEALTKEIMRLTGDDQLYFYDAIAPIIAADSIDMSIAFKAARYDKGGDDYINCPMDRRAIRDIHRRRAECEVGAAQAI